MAGTCQNCDIEKRVPIGPRANTIPLWSNILLSACRAPGVDNGTDFAALARIRWVFREALILVERVGPDSLNRKSLIRISGGQASIGEAFSRWPSAICTG